MTIIFFLSIKKSKITLHLGFNSNFMAEDKANNGKKKITLYLAIGIAVLLGLVLAAVELWNHAHKPKIHAQL